MLLKVVFDEFKGDISISDDLLFSAVPWIQPSWEITALVWSPQTCGIWKKIQIALWNCRVLSSVASDFYWCHQRKSQRASTISVTSPEPINCPLMTTPYQAWTSSWALPSQSQHWSPVGHPSNGCAMLSSKRSTLGGSQMASVDGTQDSDWMTSTLFDLCWHCSTKRSMNMDGCFSTVISAGETLLTNIE